jgi:signal transduction histidine kinase/ligand-binding sensor domain-containing protein
MTGPKSMLVQPMANRSIPLSLWVGLLLLLAGFPAWGSTNSEWFTRVWQLDDGLIDNDINGIVQGPDQYLWLVTPVGLMRFDGVSFDPFPIEDFIGRIAPHIRTMLSSRTGMLWMAFDGGKIIGLKPDYSIETLNNNLLPTRAPAVLADDAEGALWLGYPDVIYCVRHGQITKLTAVDGVPAGTFHALNNDGVGNIWLAKGNQISCFQNGKFHQIASVEGVQCLAATHTNAIWLVANAHLLSCDIKSSLRDCGTFQDPSSVRTASLLEDHSGAVWIGTDGDGLFRYDQARFERMATSHSSILSLAEDHEGNIWAGTGGGGLDRITPCGIRLEVLETDQIQSQIQSICQDANGVLWGATQNGTLVSRISSTWQPVFTNASFAGTVTCVAADRTAVWAGTRNGKLLRIVNTNYTIWETNIAHGSVHGLLAASNGNLWVVGNGVLQRINQGHLENIKLPRQSLGVYAMAEDVAGNVWIGANGALLRSNGSKLVNETPSLRVSGNPICCLYGTADGSLWIGSRGGGLLRLKKGRVDQIGLGQGLVNDYISQIVADRHGWLWFGSKHGIFKLRQSEVERAMEDHSIRLRPIIYGKNEGLISQEAVFSLASPFILPHAILSSDGRVWLLMHTGIVVADPNVLSENTKPPPILLTEVDMDGQIIASHYGRASTNIVASPETLHGPLEIPPSHRHLEFDFTAFHFRAPENLRFRYQLVGYDNDWVAAGTQRSAPYSRLIAGNYQFHVEAAIGDGPWSDPPAELDFKVIPFFWQTWWFRLGVLLVFTLSLIAIVRYVSHRRLRSKLRAAEQLAAVERERGRIARDIHDDLGNRLTEIQLLTGLARRNCEVPQKAIINIHEISSAARQATDALDEIVWAINPRNDTLPHLINYLGQFTTDYMRTAGIHCRVDLPENPPAKSVSAEVRHNLFLAIKEALNNIARHARATEVSIVILVADNSLSVIIEDNGRGFSGEVKNDGADGLENMRRRIAEINGQFQIKSEPGAGTRISFNGLWLAEN